VTLAEDAARFEAAVRAVGDAVWSELRPHAEAAVAWLTRLCGRRNDGTRRHE